MSKEETMPMCEAVAIGMNAQRCRREKGHPGTHEGRNGAFSQARDDDHCHICGREMAIEHGFYARQFCPDHG